MSSDTYIALIALVAFAFALRSAMRSRRDAIRAFHFGQIVLTVLVTSLIFWIAKSMAMADRSGPGFLNR